MTKRNLVLVHRGPEYEKDFDEIAAKVNTLDKEITIYHLPCGLNTRLPLTAWQYPTLTVALTKHFKVPIIRGPILRNVAIEKLRQQEILREHNLPTPPADLFEFGKKLDPILFGDFVLIKPINLDLTSKGDGVHVMRRVRAEQITPLRFSPDHPIRHGENFIVQRFIYTGSRATSYRITTFLGRVLFSAKYESNSVSPDLSSPDEVIETGGYTQKGDRIITLEAHDDMLSLAKSVAAAFKEIPLLGIDLVRDSRNSKLYVLEVNAGGNTWHFSSNMWAERRMENPELARAMKDQFSAFDVAAEVLAEKTHLYAS